MPQQIINLGATGSGAGGDSARTAFEKAIANFAELYIAALPGTAAQKQAARDMFGLGTAARAVLQDNAEDATPGRAVITQGAGWAARANYGKYYSSTAGANVDNALAGEAALYSTANAGTFPPVGIFWWIETQATYSGEAKLQRAYDYGSSAAPAGTHYFRIRANSSGVWTPWRLVYTSGNVLGQVAQSGGVPTGAIIERGSNANGEYVRFADGTQICWLGNSSAEAGFRVASVSAGATGTVIWGFPAAFASTPEVTAYWGSNDGNIRLNGQPQRKSNRSTTQCPINWQALQAIGGAASTLDAVAIGRWY